MYVNLYIYRDKYISYSLGLLQLSGMHTDSFCGLILGPLPSLGLGDTPYHYNQNKNVSAVIYLPGYICRSIPTVIYLPSYNCVSQCAREARALNKCIYIYI